MNLPILLQSRQIAARISTLAREIDKHYAGEEIVVVCVLKGAALFTADLVRELRTPVLLEFAQSRSYADGTSPGVENLLQGPPAETIADRHVLVVDDILDTGGTYQRLKEWLLDHEALSVRGCFLLDKPARRNAPVKADFFGFEIPDVFVVGYGMDHGEKHRNLPNLCRLDLT